MSLFNQGLKYRIYPNKNQRIFLSQHLGSKRYIYNKFLNQNNEDYANGIKYPGYERMAADLTELKEQDGYTWLNDINSQVLQQALRNLDTAYSRFFKHQARFPTFKSKHKNQSFHIPQHFKYQNGYLKIPKLKSCIKINIPKKDRMELTQDNINSLTISKTKSGEYYVSFLVEVDHEPLPVNSNVVGIDLGLTNLIVINDGTKSTVIQNPKFLKKNEKKLKELQRSLSRKKKGSKNREKARIKLAEKHSYIERCRNDNIHKLTKKITDENQVIICEDLNIQQLMRKDYYNNAQGIQDAAWGEITRQLKYKSEWKGRIYLEVDRYFASSKICNHCGHKHCGLELKDRFWICQNCHANNDRDINAAKNIRDQGLADLISEGLWDIAPRICGDLEGPQDASLVESSKSLKQEAAAFMQR